MRAGRGGRPGRGRGPGHGPGRERELRGGAVAVPGTHDAALRAAAALPGVPLPRDQGAGGQRGRAHRELGKDLSVLMLAFILIDRLHVICFSKTTLF